MGQTEDRLEMLEKKMDICEKYISTSFSAEDAKVAFGFLKNPKSLWSITAFRQPQKSGRYICDMGSNTYAFVHWDTQWGSLKDPKRWMEIPE